DACSAFDDACRDLDQTQTQRVELRPRPFRALGRGGAQSVQQPIGCGVQDQADLVRARVATRGPIGGELRLVPLDEVLRLAARAIDGLIEIFGRSRQRGDDVADVEAERRRLDAGDHAALSSPAFGAVAQPLPGASLLCTGYCASHTHTSSASGRTMSCSTGLPPNPKM